MHILLIMSLEIMTMLKYDDAKEKLKNISQLLWDYLAYFSLHKNEDSSDSNFQKIIDSYSDFKKIINPLIKTVINNVKEDHYTPVAISVPFCKIVYEDIKLYNDVTRMVDDVKKPIMKKKKVTTDPGFFGGIGNKLNGREWENIHYVEEHTGEYGKKRIKERIYAGTKTEFSEIDVWWDLIGLKKYSYSSYDSFELHCICFLKCLCLAIVNSNFQDKNQFKKHLFSYYLCLNELTNLVAKKKSGKTRTKEKQISKLIDDVNLILDESFDLSATATFVENPQITPKSWQKLFLSIREEFAIRLFFELNNFKFLAIKIIFSVEEIFLEFGIQCLKLIVYYCQFIFEFSWELYKSLRGQFKDGKNKNDLW